VAYTAAAYAGISSNVTMNTYIIFRRNHWPSEDDLQQAAALSLEVGKEMADSVKWIRSYILAEPSGKLGTVCVYQATSEEAVREHADCAGLPVDEVVQVADLVVINPDPPQET
jgi:hypothetical protein